MKTIMTRKSRRRARRLLSLLLSLMLLVGSAQAQTHRGATSGGLDAWRLDVLASWGANTVRVFLMIPDACRVERGEITKNEYIARWWDSDDGPGGTIDGVRAQVCRLKSSFTGSCSTALDPGGGVSYAASLGMSVVVVMDHPPGFGRWKTTDIEGCQTVQSYVPSRMAFRKHGWERQLYLDTWEFVATELHEAWGFDLLNEPHYKSKGWRALAIEAADVVRSVHPTARLIVQAKRGSPDKLAKLGTVPGDDVIYSFHWYRRMSLTHQGNPVTSPHWPAENVGMTYGNSGWNKDVQLAQLQGAIDFQQQHGVPIYVGEFGCARWVGGSKGWMSDFIEIAEQHDWDWSYHAFREANIWDVELGSEPLHAAPDDYLASSPKIQMLQDAFSLNEL